MFGTYFGNMFKAMVLSMGVKLLNAAWMPPKNMEQLTSNGISLIGNVNVVIVI